MKQLLQKLTNFNGSKIVRINSNLVQMLVLPIPTKCEYFKLFGASLANYLFLEQWFPTFYELDPKILNLTFCDPNFKPV